MPDDKGKRDQIAELATLAAVPLRIEVFTFDPQNDAKIVHKIRVAPMSFDLLGEVATHLAEIADSIGEDFRFAHVPKLFAENKNAVRAIIAAGTEQTPDFIGILPAGQAAHLFEVVMRVNKDFFVQSVGPEVLTTLAKILFRGVGPTLPSTSPSTDAAT